MIGASTAVIVLGLDGSLGRIDGALFVLALLAYLFRTVSSARSNADGESHRHIAKEYEEGLAAEISGTHPLWQSFALVVVGIAMLVTGSQLLVLLQQTLQRPWGQVSSSSVLPWSLSEHRYPKLQPQSLQPPRSTRPRRRKRSGLELFNLLAVLVSPLIAPIEVGDTALGFDLPFMLAVAVACLPIFVNGYVIKRWEGVLFTGYYVGYLVWLGLDAASASIHDEFNFAMLVFVVPLTAITLTVIGLRAARPAQTAVQ